MLSAARTQRRILLVFLSLAALALSPLGYAEDNGTNVKLPPPPTVTEPEPPKPMDRQKSSAAAKAMALGGAAMSNVMCMMMMSEAMKEKDKQAKAMMMMAAMQACQQGAELAKSAMENDKGQKLVSMADVPKQSQFQAKGIELPTGKPKEEAPLKALKVGMIDEGPKIGGDLPTSQLTVPDLSVFEKAAPTSQVAAENVPEATQGAQLAPEEPTSVLSPIEPGKIRYDDSAKPPAAVASSSGNGTTGAVNLGPGNLTYNASRGTDDGRKGASENGVTVAAASPGAGTSGREGRGAKTQDGGESGGGGGGGGGGAARDSEGNDPFEAMLAQLLGGGAPEGAAVPGAGSSEVTFLPKRSDPSKTSPNIFEYATFRYHKLAFELGRLRTRSKPREQLPTVTAVAKASKS